MITLFFTAAMWCGALSAPSFICDAPYVQPATLQRQYIVQNKVAKPTAKKVKVKKAITKTKKAAPTKTIKRVPATARPAPQQLSITGVITHTNRQREINGVPRMLRENSNLNAAAQARLGDMFQQQYFEHDSPQGVKPADVAGKFGYDYLQFAENIAYGPFRTDAELVQAWMDSPGHRANIVNPVFSEIGVAVGRGKLLGSDVWLGVQLFGKPAAACPAPSAELKQQIDQNNAQLAAQDADAKKLSAQIEALNPKTNAEIDEYNKQVKQYNNLLDAIQALYNAALEKHTQYNAQIDAYNVCIASPS